MNLKNIIFVFVFALVLVLTCGCIREYEFKTVNEKYEVKDIYKGFTNGYTVTVVEYYDGDAIKTVTNERKFYGRINEFFITKSYLDYPYLYKYQVNTCPHNSVRYGSDTYPRARYMLYICDDTDSIGMSMHTQNSDRSDDYSYIERLE